MKTQNEVTITLENGIDGQIRLRLSTDALHFRGDKYVQLNLHTDLTTSEAKQLAGELCARAEAAVNCKPAKPTLVDRVTTVE